MSRRIISDVNAEVEIAIGYDAPLDTFYCQVIILAPESEPQQDHNILLWRGTSHREIETTTEIAEILEPYNVFTPAMKDLLEADRQREKSEPTRLQRQMLAFIQRNQKTRNERTN